MMRGSAANFSVTAQLYTRFKNKFVCRFVVSVAGVVSVVSVVSVVGVVSVVCVVNVVVGVAWCSVVIV